MSQWLTSVVAKFKKRGTGQRSPRPRRACPGIEALEQRLVRSGIWGWGNPPPPPPPPPTSWSYIVPSGHGSDTIVVNVVAGQLQVLDNSSPVPGTPLSLTGITSISLTGGTNTTNAFYIQGTPAGVATTVNLMSGADSVTVGYNGTTDNIRGGLSINGTGAGSVTLSDSAHSGAAVSAAVSATSAAGLGAPVSYRGVNVVNVLLPTDGAGNQYSVTGSAGTTTLSGLRAGDAVAVSSAAGTVNLQGQGGSATLFGSAMDVNTYQAAPGSDVLTGSPMGSTAGWGGSSFSDSATGLSLVAYSGPEPVADAAYSPPPGTLFNPVTGTPSYTDVKQTSLGDCWLLAPLAEVAARAPQVLQSMFTPAGTTTINGSVVNVYTVRFYNSSGVAEYVDVDTELPAGGSSSDPVDQPINGVLWAALAEKAYAEANGAGMVSSSQPGNNSYDALNGGLPSWAFQAITGHPVTDNWITSDNMVSAWNGGQLLALTTPDTGSTPTVLNGATIVPDHVYAVVGYNPGTQVFTLFNPWGVGGGRYLMSNGQLSPFCAGFVTGTAPQLSADFYALVVESVGAAASVKGGSRGEAIMAFGPGAGSGLGTQPVSQVALPAQSPAGVPQRSLALTSVKAAHDWAAIFSTGGARRDDPDAVDLQGSTGELNAPGESDSR